MRDRVAPGVPSGAPVARSDRQAETAGAVILCSSPWFYAHLLLPAPRQAARALRRTNGLETCVAPIGSKMGPLSHWLKYTPKVFMPSAKAELRPKAIPDVEQVQLRIWFAGHGLASGLNVPNILQKIKF